MYEQIAANKRKTGAARGRRVPSCSSAARRPGARATSSAPVRSASSSRSPWRWRSRSARTSTATGWCSRPRGRGRSRPRTSRRLHNLVEGLAIAAGIPKPRIYVVPEQAPNAFATGRDPEHASIAVTEGLLATMSRVELEGVIGHELAHVLDRDMLLGTIVATLVGAVVLMSEFLMRSWWWGGIGGRRGNDNTRRSPRPWSSSAVGFALMVLAPIAGEVIKRVRLAEPRVPRRRARRDAHPVSARPRRGPARRSRRRPTAMHSANNATAHLWLSQPSRIEGEKLGPMEQIFATRIRRSPERIQRSGGDVTFCVESRRQVFGTSTSRV